MSKKIEFIVRPKNRYLHSREHVLADDLSRAMLEPKKFAAYLGIAKLYFESDLRALMKNVLEKKDLNSKNRGKYFFGALRRLERIPVIGHVKSNKKEIKIKKAAKHRHI